MTEAIRRRWRERPRRDRRWQVFVTVGTVLLLVALLGLVAYYREPRGLKALALAAGSPYLLLAAPLALICFVLARGLTGWAGAALAAGLVAWTAALVGPLFVATTAPPGRDVVVMTANLRLGGADAAAVVAAVRRHHVEVLMLEELTPQEEGALRAAGLDRLLPYGRWAPGWNASGSALLSRYPTSQDAVDPRFPFAFVRARVAVPGLTPAPTMVALHVFGPSPASQTAQWKQDMSRLPAALRELPGDAPVVVGGDFNATMDVVQFRRLLHGGYADAADQAGAGLTPTYPANRLVALIGIDHVLTRAAVARRVDAVRLPGSDHRGLVVTVRLPARAAGQ